MTQVKTPETIARFPGTVEEFMTILKQSRTKLEKVVLWAVAHKRQDVLSLVISSGANLEKYDTRGYTPLGRAVIAGEKKAVQMLLAAGADPEGEDGFGVKPLTYAKRGHRVIIGRLIREFIKNQPISDEDEMEDGPEETEPPQRT